MADKESPCPVNEPLADFDCLISEGNTVQVGVGLVMVDFHLQMKLGVVLGSDGHLGQHNHAQRGFICPLPIALECFEVDSQLEVPKTSLAMPVD